MYCKKGIVIIETGAATMRIKNKAASVVMKCAVLSASGAGMYILSGAAVGRIRWANLVYYTNLSNLACFVFYLFLIVITIAVTNRELKCYNEYNCYLIQMQFGFRLKLKH